MDKQVEVRDSIDRFCGYLTERQLRAANEKYHRDGNVLRLDSIPASECRRTLLQMSLQSRDLTPQQNTKVSAQLSLIAENDAYKRAPVPSFTSPLDQIALSESYRPVPMSNDSTGQLYVTRDFNGYYLGLFTCDSAKQIWRNVILTDNIIEVRDDLLYRVSRGVLDPKPSQIAHYSKATLTGIEEAAKFSNRLDRMRDLRGYWKSRTQYTYNVFGEQDEPLCCIPYGNMPAFGSNWIVTGDASIQLVSNWDEAKIASRVGLAVTSASAMYEVIAPAGERSVRDGEQNNGSTNNAGLTANQATNNPDKQLPSSDVSLSVDSKVAFVPRETIVDTMTRLIKTCDIPEHHASAIIEAIEKLSNRGRKSALVKLLKASYPDGIAELPHSGMMNIHLIPPRMIENTLDEADIISVIQSIHASLSKKAAVEAAAEEARAKKLADAKRHDHAALAWAETMLNSSDASSVERELARAVKARAAPVLVMQDDELYRSVLNTDMNEQHYISAVEYVPFTHFIVRTPSMTGVYGFGVVANEDGTGASIVIVTDGSAKSESSDLLDKYFKKLLFFICTNRESLGLAPAVAPKGYRKEEQADRRTSGSPKKRSKPGRSSQPDDDGDVVQGQVFELGTRVVYLSAGKGLNGDYHSGRDIRPHAVAGYTQVRNGKTIKVRPHWNHGSGIKRNELPREIVERNIKLN